MGNDVAAVVNKRRGLDPVADLAGGPSGTLAAPAAIADKLIITRQMFTGAGAV